MKLYMKQKMFSLKQDFDVVDEDMNPIYHVEGKLFSLGRQLRIYDSQTNAELAFIKQKLMMLLQTMEIYRGEVLQGTVAKKLSFLNPKFEIGHLGWQVEGNFFGYDYQITDDEGFLIATIRAKVWSFVDSFEIEIFDDEDFIVDPVMVLAVVLAIDLTRDAS